MCSDYKQIIDQLQLLLIYTTFTKQKSILFYLPPRSVENCRVDVKPERKPGEEESDGEGEEDEVCSLLPSCNSLQGRSPPLNVNFRYFPLKD